MTPFFPYLFCNFILFVSTRWNAIDICYAIWHASIPAPHKCKSPALCAFVPRKYSFEAAEINSRQRGWVNAWHSTIAIRLHRNFCSHSVSFSLIKLLRRLFGNSKLNFPVWTFPMSICALCSWPLFISTQMRVHTAFRCNKCYKWSFIAANSLLWLGSRQFTQLCRFAANRVSLCEWEKAVEIFLQHWRLSCALWTSFGRYQSMQPRKPSKILHGSRQLSYPRIICLPTVFGERPHEIITSIHLIWIVCFCMLCLIVENYWSNEDRGRNTHRITVTHYLCNPLWKVESRDNAFECVGIGHEEENGAEIAPAMIAWSWNRQTTGTNSPANFDF